jgi:hypothetical protein
MNAWDQTVNDGAGGYVPRAPDLDPVVWNNSQDKARAFGIDPEAYGDNWQQMEADLAAVEQRHNRLTKDGKYTVEDIDGGGTRYKPGEKLLQQQEARKRTGALRSLASRFQREMNADRDRDGRPDFTFADLEAAYDDPANQGKSHQERMLAVNNGVVDQFRTDRAMNIQETIEQRAKQDNMARRLGVPVGSVMFNDDMMNARTPEDRIRVLLARHDQAPGMGYGNMAAYTQRGQDEARSMEAIERREAERARTSNPVLQGPQDQAYIDSLPLGTARMEARKNATKKGYADGAAPPDAVHDAIINGEVDNVRSLVGKQGLTGDEMAHLREWTSAFLQRNHKGAYTASAFDNWAKMIGVTPWSPQSKRLWRMATGKNIEEKNSGWMPDDAYYRVFGGDPRQLPDPGA